MERTLIRRLSRPAVFKGVMGITSTALKYYFGWSSSSRPRFTVYVNGTPVEDLRRVNVHKSSNNYIFRSKFVRAIVHALGARVGDQLALRGYVSNGCIIAHAWIIRDQETSDSEDINHECELLLHFHSVNHVRQSIRDLAAQARRRLCDTHEAYEHEMYDAVLVTVDHLLNSSCTVW